MTSELPEILYVREIEEREPEDNFLQASIDAGDLSEAESKIEVGEYKLVRTVNLVNKTKIVIGD